MKILAIGDTHGHLEMVRDIWPKLKDIDLVIHTGDNYADAVKLRKELDVPFVSVKGNCDGCYSSDRCSPSGGDFAVAETEFGRLLVTHGHCEHVNYAYDNLIYKALENDCAAVIFGHTHNALVAEQTVPLNPAHSTVWLVNPGSLPFPRDGSGGSYAVIKTGETFFTASIVYYNTIMNSNKKSGRTGFISNLLNYSDRL